MAASAVGDATKGVYFDNLGVPQFGTLPPGGCDQSSVWNGRAAAVEPVGEQEGVSKLGRAKEAPRTTLTKSSACGFNPYDGALYFSTDARIWGSLMETIPVTSRAVSLRVTVDLDASALYLSINGGADQRMQVEVPKAVRPWALLLRDGDFVSLGGYEQPTRAELAALPQATSRVSEGVRQRWAELEARYLSAEAVAKAAAARKAATTPSSPQPIFRRVLGELLEDIGEMQAEDERLGVASGAVGPRHDREAAVEERLGASRQRDADATQPGRESCGVSFVAAHTQLATMSRPTAQAPW
eukprot:CAMPEP_0119352846 /NCGR_PEP_ID=MMETSP1334-20130426/2042_1 /TAXON_ID=127549 /ORGANISM="Calcidiscus leptoporus, Strain RCC1130" /LENGTH=298 /DNA_ID=CAMNT_0007365969 /DNA_START=629 /DNA_END=1523 /DNA_ORIENTATION=+